TPANLQAASNQITRSLPANDVVGASNWLEQKISADVTTSVMIPFLLAFSIFALVVAAMIIGNVVSGAVIAGYRDIGVMKAIGFTPLQVLAVLVVQILIPATAGAAAGVVVGLLASQPFLGQTADAFDLPTPSGLVPWVIAVCFGTALAVVLLATLIPGLRAARLSAAEAITAGTSPGLRRGHVLARVLARVPISRAATIGATDSVVRPVRSGMTLVAVALGVATVTFATGLTASLGDVKAALVRSQQVQVIATRDGGGYLGAPMSDAQLTSLIQRQSGTQRVTAEGQTQAHITGLSQPIPIYGYRGASNWIGYVLIHGRWFAGTDEAVAPTALLTTAGLHLGDTVRISENGRVTRVRLVGEIFDQQDDNLLLRTDWSTLASLPPGAEPQTYAIAVSGDARQYA
ncbi:MAG: FtsX-like permease family protein, partial [Candidatus Dormibacteria bacterium]